MKRVGLVVLLLLMSCAEKTEVLSIGDSQARLNQNAVVLVSIPADGSYGGKPYPGSGLATAKALKAALSRYSRPAIVSTTAETFDQAMSTAKGYGASYLVHSEILQWVDRATEWSGKPDRAEVKVEIADPISGVVVHSVVLRGRSSWWTFGGDHPQDLLYAPAASLARSLFAR